LQTYSLAYFLDDILYEEGNTLEEDATLGLDHMDRTRTTRNGAEMFLK
jgi:ubiquitin carboxyl-terminal hydrolase 7